MDAILRLFKGEIVTETTDWYTMEGARLHLLPYTKPYPEVAVVSSNTPSGGRLAGKYDAVARPRQPDAQRRIELRIEEGISSAGERIVFPDHLAPGHEIGAFGAEPVECARQARRTFLRHQGLRRVARAAAGKQRQNAAGAALLLVPFPQGAERERRPERPRPARHAPEPA